MRGTCARVLVVALMAVGIAVALALPGFIGETPSSHPTALAPPPSPNRVVRADGAFANERARTKDRPAQEPSKHASTERRSSALASVVAHLAPARRGRPVPGPARPATPVTAPVTAPTPEPAPPNVPAPPSVPAPTQTAAPAVTEPPRELASSAPIPPAPAPAAHEVHSQPAPDPVAPTPPAAAPAHEVHTPPAPPAAAPEHEVHTPPAPPPATPAATPHDSHDETAEKHDQASGTGQGDGKGQHDDGAQSGDGHSDGHDA
jgi:hypothetical protein